ncbi:MAG: hypothetical protein H8E57_07050 [Candidatus Cloacimonetes bacterium]|nr:hypothetical protein [Candidatus Cloacimonadota bacterium]
MFKNWILILVLFMSVSIMSAGKHDNSEYDLFNNYQVDSSVENFVKAIEFYNSKLDSEEQEFSNNLLLSYLNYMELENNLQVLEENLEKLDNRTKFSYANLLLSLGKYEDCIEIYDSINEETPKWSCPWRHKGEAQLKFGELDEAEKSTLKAIETRIDHFDAYTQLAEIRIELGKSKLALESFNKGMEYYDADTEEEITDLDVKFLHLELLKINKLDKEFQKLKSELMKTAPNDRRWEKF